MSAMSFREPNEIRWIGVRPAHKGTQVIKDGTANNNTVIIHTVSTGKTFYLTFFRHDADFITATSYATLFVRDDSDVTQYALSHYQGRVSGTFGKAVGLYFPIEIPAGWDICVTTSSTDVRSRATIHGWEE